MYVVFLKIITFLWLTLILHLGHTSLFLETVRIKYMESRGRGAQGPGPRKTNTPIIILTKGLEIKNKNSSIISKL